MKKLFGVLIIAAILLSSLMLPVYADNIENKDDSRLDLGEIFGYAYKITFIDGQNVSENEYYENEEIKYPELTPSREYDIMWSLSEDEYIAPPTTMSKENVTVYSFKTDVIGFENYPFKNNVTSDIAYNGNKSFKYTNDGSSANTIALGKTDNNVAYKISFKYYVSNELKGNYYVTPSTADINFTEDSVIKLPASKFNIASSVKTGVWMDGEIYFTANPSTIEGRNNIYLEIVSETVNSDESIYFDNVSIKTMATADFILPEGFATTSTNGTLSNNTFTAYFGIGEKITAPVVLTADGTPVVWIDEDDIVTTEFKENGIYRVKMDAKGDLNVDGAVTTIDLALMKLYLVEQIDVTEINAKNGDINSDGNVDLIDMAYLKLYLANLIEIN